MHVYRLRDGERLPAGRGIHPRLLIRRPERGATTCRFGITRRPSGSGSWA